VTHTHYLCTLAPLSLSPFLSLSRSLSLSLSLLSRKQTFWANSPSQRVSIRQHTPAYVSIRQHTSAYVSIHPHTSAYIRIRQHMSAHVSIRQHTPAYVRIRRINTPFGPTALAIEWVMDPLPVPEKHTSAYVSIRQHTSAYVSIRQHTSAYVSIRMQTMQETMRLTATKKNTRY
jgi:hypothetical protein